MGLQWREKKTTVGNITANKQTQLIAAMQTGRILK